MLRFSSDTADENVITIDSDSAPRILFYGEDFLCEDLPVGTRVIYPRRPIAGLPNPSAAIRYALHHPEEMEPLHALLSPGMKVTIAVDDISLPLPPMQRPDVRERICSIVLQMLADHGVDDIHIIVATSLHRRMTEREIRYMLGDKIVDAYWPARLYNHDACDPDNMVVLGKTRHHEVVETNRRAIESDLVSYVNINLVPMDGGPKSVGVGLCGYESLKAHHTPKTIVERDALMAEIEQVRRDGIAFDDGELDAEVRCVAVPVRDFLGRVAGAIGISGPMWRLPLQSLHEKSKLVRQSAAELSLELGYRGEADSAIA